MGCEREALRRYLDSVEAADNQEEVVIDHGAVAAALEKLRQHPEPEARYDVMGRVLTRRQTISGITKNISYTYTLNGSINSVTYPSGRVVNYAYNTAGEPVSAIDATSGTRYVSGAHYNAAGMPTTMIQGAVPGLNAVNISNAFNNRLQVTRQQAISGVPATLMDLSYSYSQSLPTVIKNNGNVLNVTNNKDNTRSVAFSFDQVNRIASAQSTSWTNSYVYDPWSNLLQKNGTIPETLTVAVNAKNQILGETYDASGNDKFDTVNALNFNAENQATPASGLTYTYDGAGRRVEKSTTSLYWDDDNSWPLAVSDTTGAIKTEFVFFAGKRVAAVSLATGNSFYYLSNHLGSTSVITSGDGKAVVWEADYYPYGDNRVITNNFENHYLFTGYEYDYETGYHYALNRLQNPKLGRFMSPDPIRGNISNPQGSTGERMSLTISSGKHRFDSLAIVGGFVALLDTAVGGIVLLGLDLSRTNELVFGVSLVLGMPMYLLDLWINNRLAICLLWLFLFRWGAQCFLGPRPSLSNPFVWPVGLLLFVALVLLQASKLRRRDARL